MIRLAAMITALLLRIRYPRSEIRVRVTVTSVDR